jgi:hypothetical protein
LVEEWALVEELVEELVWQLVEELVLGRERRWGKK